MKYYGVIPNESMIRPYKNYRMEILSLILHLFMISDIIRVGKTFSNMEVWCW